MEGCWQGIHKIKAKFKGKTASCGWASLPEQRQWLLPLHLTVENSQEDSKGKTKSRNTSANARGRRSELKVDEARPRQVEETGRKTGVSYWPTATILKPGHATSTQEGLYRDKYFNNQG